MFSSSDRETWRELRDVTYPWADILDIEAAADQTRQMYKAQEKPAP